MRRSGIRSFFFFGVLVVMAVLSASAQQTKQRRYWCHDHTLKLVTGVDMEFTPNIGKDAIHLRDELRQQGYEHRSYVNLDAVGTVATRAGDVLIIGESHSGVFVGTHTVSHYFGDYISTADELIWTVDQLKNYVRTHNPRSGERLHEPKTPFRTPPVELWRKGSRPPPSPKCETIADLKPAGPYRVGDLVSIAIHMTSGNYDVVNRVFVAPEFNASVRSIPGKNVGHGVWEADFTVEVPSTNPPFVDYDLSGRSDDGTVVSCRGRVPFEVAADALEVELEGPTDIRVGEKAQYVVRMIGGLAPYTTKWRLHDSSRTTRDIRGTRDDAGRVWSDGQEIVWDSPGDKLISVDVVPASGPSREASMATIVHPADLKLTIDGPRTVFTGQKAAWVLRTGAIIGAGASNGNRAIYDYLVRWDQTDHTRYLNRGSPMTVERKFRRPGQVTIPMEVVDTSIGVRGSAELVLTIEDGAAEVVLHANGPTTVSPGDSPEWTFSVDGGAPPYEVRVVWGDTLEDQRSGVMRDLTIGHSFQPGREVVLRAVAKDSRGNVSDWVNLRVDVDVAEDLIRFERTAVTVAEDGTTAKIMVIREGRGRAEATVVVETADLSAVAGTDYVAKTFALKFAAGQPGPIPVLVDILDDRDDEGDEVFRLVLTNPTGARLPTKAEARVTIADNDAPGRTQKASFEPRDYMVGEGGGAVRVVVKRLGGIAGTLLVDYATHDASAEAGRDFHPSSGTIVWPPGNSDERDFWVAVLQDDEVEREETVHLQLSDPRNDVVPMNMDEGSEAIIRIADDDTVETVSEPEKLTCDALIVTVDRDELREGQTARLTVRAEFSDGKTADVTDSPLLSWRNGNGPQITAPLEMRFSESIEAVADYNGGECIGRARVLLQPPSWRPPISDADELGAVVSMPPPDAFTWFVVCNKATDPCSVAYSEQVDFTRQTVMSEALPGPRTAEQWIDLNCPSERCTAAGACAIEPVRGGEWGLLCNSRTGELTLAREQPSSFDQRVLEGNFCGEPDARWWVEDNCPSWRCDASGRCADGPSSTPPGGDGWYVVCFLPTGDVEIGKRPFDSARQSELGGPFLGEPDARRWTEENCPSWLCGPSGCRTADRGDVWNGGRRSGGGFVELGQKEGEAEDPDDRFVDIGSDEALQLLNDAQRAYFESQVRGRGLNPDSFGVAIDELMAGVDLYALQPDPAEGVGEIFEQLVQTAIWIATGEKPPGLDVGPYGGGSPAPPLGGGSGKGGGGTMGGGGLSWDACVQKYCPHCGDSIMLGAESADDQCNNCTTNKRRQIDDCTKGGAAAEKPDADIQSFRNFQVQSCWTETWDASQRASRRRYSCHCVGPGLPRPGGKAGCEPFGRGESFTQVECEFKLGSCMSVASQMNFVESQRRGK